MTGYKCATCSMCVCFDDLGRNTRVMATHGVCLKEGDALDAKLLHEELDPEETCWEGDWDDPAGWWAA